MDGARYPLLQGVLPVPLSWDSLNGDFPMTLLHAFVLTLATTLVSVQEDAKPLGVQDAGAASFSFALVADIQYAPKPDAGLRRYGSSLERLKQAVLDWSAEELAFLVQLGDVIDGRDSDEHERADLEQVLDVLESSSLPLRHVVGNHGLELPRSVLQERLGLDSSWYSFVQGSWRFLVVDSLWLGTVGRIEGDPLFEDAALFLKHFGKASGTGRDRPQARTWNGGLGPEQRAWLADELAQAGKAKQRAVIFSHLPVHPASATPGNVLWDSEDVLAILEGAPAFHAWIAGHHHAGGYAKIAGRHFLTLKGMLEAEAGTNAFAVVHADAKSLLIDGRGKVERRLLAVSNELVPSYAFRPAPSAASYPKAANYMGREVARTMHWKGAEWLRRETREQEESSAQLLDALGLQAGWSVADFGCGNGYFSLPMAELVGDLGRVFCLDIQEEMLVMLRDQAEENGTRNLVPVLSSELSTGLEPVSCDMILMVDVYHELDRPELVLDEARRALKAGGLLALVEYRAEDPEVPIKPKHKMSRDAVIRELSANGFALAREYERLPMQHLLLFRARW
jgi:ubiquinone/menaquinone biosynthesis C-methylase UbiE